MLARAWAAGAGPGDSPLTIDLDSTICETYGLAKEGARHHGYTGARGYHPLLAIAAGTGEVLMSRLREGRANTARGAAHFLRETVGRVRYGGARGQLTVRADSGFYAHTVVAACREMDVRFSITIRQRASLRDLIEAIPEEDWTPIPYWTDGAADVAETTYTPFQPLSPVPLLHSHPFGGFGLSRDFTAHIAGFPTAWQKGPEGIKRLTASMRDAFADIVFAYGLMFARGGKVVVQWTMTGTHQGDIFGVAPTGRSVSVTGTDIYLVSPTGPGGKIVEMWTSWDQWGLL